MDEDQLLLDPENDPFAVPIATEPAEIREELYAAMREQFPDWEPVPTALDTQLINGLSQITADSRNAFIARLRAELRALLGSMFGVPRLLGLPARSTITVTAIDSLGHTMPAGTTVWVGDVECETPTDLVIVSGQLTGRVAIQTVDPGAAANGAAASVEVDAIDWLAETDAVVLDDPLGLGVDPEDDATYDPRLAEELQLLTRAPILTPNFAVVAKRHPLVMFAWAIDLYDPVTRTTDNDRYVTVVIAGALAAALPDDVCREVQALIEALRETNFRTPVVTPSYVEVDVTCDVVMHPGWDLEQGRANVALHLQSVLSPANWVQPPYGRDPGYVPTRIVHRNELLAQADTVLGVDYVPDLRIGDGTRDTVTLGPLELPTPGVITVTARAP